MNNNKNSNNSRNNNNTKNDDTLLDKSLKDAIIKFRDDRDWKQFHSPENLAKSISIEAAELLENFQWTSDFDKEKVIEELADVIMYCVLLSDVLDVDIDEIVKSKLRKNIEKYPVDKARGNSRKYNEL
jgi:dCTP diphosphatase